MRSNLLLLIIFFITGSISAQEIQRTAKAKSDHLDEATSDTSSKHWRIKSIGSLQFSQSAFSNWAAGGQNAMGLVAWVNFKANLRSGKHVWANTIDLGYGFNLQGKASSALFTKTNDKIEITTAYGFQIHKNNKWYLTVLGNFRTQFAEGFNYPDDSTVISRFMAPGYLVVGIGVTYAPAKWFSLYFSPASGRFTFVTSPTLADAGAFGVDSAYTDASGVRHHGKTMRGEFGPYLRADLNKDLVKNINLTSSLELFTDYLHNFGNIDVNWSLYLTMKVNKWLAASIQTQLIYDDDVMIKPDPTERARPMTQFKEMLGIGLSYKIN